MMTEVQVKECWDIAYDLKADLAYFFSLASNPLDEHRGPIEAKAKDIDRLCEAWLRARRP